MKRLLPLLLLAALPTLPLLAADDPCVGQYASIHSVLWQQTAAEYDAITRQVYGAARRNLDAAVAGPGDPLGRQPAIVLDIDETVLDTTTFQSGMTRNRKPFTEDAFHQYALHDVSRPIPAALDFLNYAASKNVAIFFVTNRDVSEKPALLETLAHYHYPTDDKHVLTKNEQPNWTSDKTSRREYVAARYALLMLFGDDLNDFISTSGKTIEQRRQIVADNAAKLGTVWYVLPNPTYGSWERALGAKDTNGDCGAAEKLKMMREDKQWQ